MYPSGPPPYLSTPAGPSTYPAVSSGHASAPSSGARVPLDREMKLINSRKDKEQMDIQSEVFALLHTTNRLEILYSRGAIGKDEVSWLPLSCDALLHQVRAVRDQLPRAHPPVQAARVRPRLPVRHDRQGLYRQEPVSRALQGQLAGVRR
jgi:hypothetical protein